MKFLCIARYATQTDTDGHSYSWERVQVFGTKLGKCTCAFSEVAVQQPVTQKYPRHVWTGKAGSQQNGDGSYPVGGEGGQETRR